MWFIYEYDAIEFTSCADDIIPYNYGQSFDEVIKKLEIDMTNIYDWFHQNGFKANPGKFHFFLSPFVGKIIKVVGSTLEASKEEVLLGARIDSDLTFKEHVTNICSKANQNLHALTRANTSSACSYKSTTFSWSRVSLHSLIIVQ